MKKIFITIVCLSVLLLPTVIKAQFNQTHYYTGNCALPGDWVLGGVAVDTNNNKWFGTDQGVAKFDGTTWTTFTTSNGLPSNIISCIAVDKNNNVWIGTDGDGVAKYNGTTWTAYSVSNGLCDNGVSYIATENNGDVWFTSAAGCVSKLSGTTWTPYSSGLPIDQGSVAGVSFVTVDGSGNKWFGTNKGISKYNGSSFSTIYLPLSDSSVNSIAIDGGNKKWVGTPVGISVLNSSDVLTNTYTSLDGLYNNFVKDLDFDSHGNLWVGLYTDYNNDAGISKFDGTNWVSCQIDFPDSVSADWIYRLAVDKNDDVWIAMDYGVIKIDHTSGINENTENLSMNIYPNPVTEQLNISINTTENSKNRTIELFSSIQKVGEYIMPDNSGKIVIPVNNLANGLYFVKFGNVTRKIIVSR